MTAPDASSDAGAAGSNASSAPRSTLAKRMDLIATILLSAATVLTAWSAFQSAKWNGVQATAFSQASASRAESVRASTLAGQQAVVDASVFTAWLTAADQGQTRLAGLIAARFRGEFKTAFDAWQATSPLTNPSAPPTPFAMPNYHPAAVQQAADLEARAVTEFNEATTANDVADNYVLMTVLFAAVLFFDAISLRFEAFSLEVALLGAAGVLFVAAAAVTATFPIEL